MSQTHTIGRAHTTVKRVQGTLFVTYHSTDVVVASPDGTVTLNTGGWRSNTTKLRMNQAANQYGLGFMVSQKNFDWFVSFANPKFTRYGEGEPYWLPEQLPFDGRTITFKIPNAGVVN